MSVCVSVLSDHTNRRTEMFDQPLPNQPSNLPQVHHKVLYVSPLVSLRSCEGFYLFRGRFPPTYREKPPHYIIFSCEAALKFQMPVRPSVH